MSFNLKPLPPKVGHEILLNRHFYTNEQSRQLDEIEVGINGLEIEIIQLVKEITA